MASRSARRNAHKRLARSHNRGNLRDYSPEACAWLAQWRTEAYRRARRLGAPAAWALLREQPVASLLRRLDPSGELVADLRHVIALAVAAASAPRLVKRGRPRARSIAAEEGAPEQPLGATGTG
jgi:hypothetical protein